MQISLRLQNPKVLFNLFFCVWGGLFLMEAKYYFKFVSFRLYFAILFWMEMNCKTFFNSNKNGMKYIISSSVQFMMFFFGNSKELFKKRFIEM